MSLSTFGGLFPRERMKGGDEFRKPPLYPNDRVKFDPPENAYSARSAQAVFAGMTGAVTRPWASDFAQVRFGNSLIVCSVAYLEKLP